MSLKACLIPAALVVAAAPAHAATLCAVAPGGFDIQNGDGGWKLVLLPQGGSVVTWSFPGHSLAVCMDATPRIKVVVQVAGEARPRAYALDRSQGLAPLQDRWAKLTGDFRQAVAKDGRGSLEQFQSLMIGVQVLLGAELGKERTFLRGDQARAEAIGIYWSRTDETAGLGDLEALMAFLDTYRKLRTSPPDGIRGPSLGGLLTSSELQLIPPHRLRDGNPAPDLASLVARVDRTWNPDKADAAPGGTPERKVPVEAKGEGAGEPKGPGLALEDVLDTPEKEARRKALAKPLVAELEPVRFPAGPEEGKSEAPAQQAKAH